MTVLDMLAIARNLRARGLSVIPLDHPDETTQADNPEGIGKVPVVAWKEFQRTPPTDAQLVRWFGNGHKRNIGIPTGPVSGVVVVDADSVEGLAWMRANLPPTSMRTRTAKGEHWYYKHPGIPVSNKARIHTGNPAVKIDIRADGGQAVAPGSKHASGVLYEPIGEWCAIDALPIFDSAWLEDEAPPSTPTRRESESIDRQGVLRRARAHIDATPPAVEGEGGDAHTFRLCCALTRGFDLSEDDAFELLREWNARCEPKWDSQDLRVKIKNAREYGEEPIGGRIAGFPCTDSGDAEHFAALYAGRVLYDARRSRWLLIEDGSGLWLPDPVERLRGYAVVAMRDRQREANAISDLEKRKQAWTWAFKGESTSRLTNMLREARTQPAIRNDSLTDPWDADPYLLSVRGGVVDLRTGQQRKARPEERVTMRAPIDYDPSARSELWERTLLAISDDDTEWVNYLQRVGGYTTTGDVSQDKWFIKHGKNGREGKGTVDGAWAGALGDYVLELPSAVFELRPKGNPDFDLSYLPNKRFVLSSESGNTVHLHHDRIKQMTGGGSMRVANKHEKSFEFVPQCKLWLACNDLPTVTDDSAAFWARVIVIPFRRSFLGKEDTTLRPALSNDPAHRRAVLAWLVNGAIDYCREGLGDMPRSVADATSAFRDVAWPLTPLVKEDCIVAPDARVSVGDFNLAYQRFCERQGVPKEKRLGWKRVLKLMEARYETVSVDETTQGDVRVREKRYVGITLREPIAEHVPVPAGGVPF